jgi:hypothetical protein
MIEKSLNSTADYMRDLRELIIMVAFMLNLESDPDL